MPHVVYLQPHTKYLGGKASVAESDDAFSTRLEDPSNLPKNVPWFVQVIDTDHTRDFVKRLIVKGELGFLVQIFDHIRCQLSVHAEFPLVHAKTDNFSTLPILWKVTYP
eukprot:CAMPEP_0116869614 /NCGR_PEP_ID=MMETSP0418-20121206/27856_1 /TAXON_ID=1158023 /ORGANISM="Astrosyne radiata, Strain 13vi08-1A" /LENGTH=108 /DNA_ID=CAMNT_0004505727 /DNA_START=109 /DNA_END=435 /DNA_ORIENTATION=-